MRTRDPAGAGIVGSRPDGLFPYRNILTETAVENHFRRQAKPVRMGEDVVPVPWPAWARACMDDGGQMGLAKGWHVILAGNTGAGKSIFALNMAAASIKAGVTVGFVNLEMSADQIMSRLLGILTGEPVAIMQRGRQFDPGASERVQERLQEIVGDARLLVNDDELAEEPLQRLDEIVSLVKHWATEHDAGLIVVDYMQLAGTGAAEEVAERVTQISRGIRGVARKQKVVTLGLSQFNRGTSANYHEPPKIQGLFGASGLENDASQVAMIDHSAYARQENGAQTWLTLGKNRHGPLPDIPVWFDYSTLRVTEALPHEEASWPNYTERTA